MKTKMWTVRSIACLVAGASSCVALAQHAGDVWVGRTDSANPPISIHVGGFDTNNLVVLPPVNGILHGWSNNSPGFDHLVNAVPAQNLYPLQSGANIWFQVVKFDPAFRVIDNGFNILDQPGQQTSLGTETLHTHLIWHINSQDPAFDPNKWLWSAKFKLIDTGSTIYLPDTLTMKFSIVPCIPGDTNNDGSINQFDIQGFVQTLTSGGTLQQNCAADVNQDGSVNQFDIQAFVNLLSGP